MGSETNLARFKGDLFYANYSGKIISAFSRDGLVVVVGGFRVVGHRKDDSRGAP